VIANQPYGQHGQYGQYGQYGPYGLALQGIGSKCNTRCIGNLDSLCGLAGRAIRVAGTRSGCLVTCRARAGRRSIGRHGRSWPYYTPESESRDNPMQCLGALAAGEMTRRGGTAQDRRPTPGGKPCMAMEGSTSRPDTNSRWHSLCPLTHHQVAPPAGQRSPP